MRVLPTSSPQRTMSMVELADYLEASPPEVLRLFRLPSKPRFPGFKVGNKWCANVKDLRDWLLDMLAERGNR